MRTKLLAPLIGLALVSGLSDAATQAAEKVYQIGFVTLGGPSAPIVVTTLEGLRRALAQRGYSVGSNLVIETRFAEGDRDRLPALVKELVDRHVDVIATSSYPAARAAKEGTATIPIVVDGAGDPVETGLAMSLSRPGGNLTGMSDMASELSTKRLELLGAAVPGLKRVAILFNADDAGMTSRYRAAAAVGPKAGIAVQGLGVREPNDFDAAFAAMASEKPDGILMVTDMLINLNRKRVIEFAAAHRIPAIYEFEYFVREGGLMSYGAERSETTERVAALIDRILKGAKPADLPFEQPTRFRLVMNRKSAEALGLGIPESFYERADEVIE